MSNFRQSMSTRDMLNMAYSNSEESNESRLLDKIDVDPSVLVENEGQQFPKEETYQAPTTESYFIPNEVENPAPQQYSFQDYSNQTTAAINHYEEPSPKPVAVYEEPKQEEIPSPATSRFTSMDFGEYTPSQPLDMSTSESDYTPEAPTAPTVSLELIEKILNISNFIGNLDPNVKIATKQYLGVQSDNVAEMINALFTLDIEERESLSGFIQIKEKERQLRAFELMGLYDTNFPLIREIQRLTAAFSGERFVPTAPEEDRMRFCMEIEMGIDSLDPRALSVLKPIVQLFEFL